MSTNPTGRSPVSPEPHSRTEPISVAFDAGPWLDLRTGVGRYADELAARLEAAGVRLVPYAVALRGRSRRPIRRLHAPARFVQNIWRRFNAPSIARLTGSVDVVHGTNFVLPALPEKTPGVVTIHDLSFLRGDAFPGAHRLIDLAAWSVRRAACVLTPTEAVADEVSEHFGVEREAIRVTHEGVAQLFFAGRPLADSTLATMGIRRPYAVAVGTLEPRKNLPRLLQAWENVHRELDGWTLVVVGPRGWGPDLVPPAGVVLTGWIGDETLPGLLAAAEFFCYPSLYEGFGLPPLEAMAAGTACLVGDYSAAEEVLGDAAIRVDPEDSGALVVQLTRLATDEALRRRLALAGRARAARFSWAETARRTLEAYFSVL